jgi:copper transport protein
VIRTPATVKGRARASTRVARSIALVAPLVVAALLVWAALPASIDAHARLRATVPAAGATLGSPPAFVTLTFSELPDVRLTTIKVLDRGGTDRATGPAEAITEPPMSVRVPVADLPDGGYTVSWRTVSAVDGHISAGSFVFGVGAPAPTAPPDATPGGASESGSPPAIGMRWVLYLGLMLLLGAAWVALAIAGRRRGDLLVMAAAGWVLTAVGTLGVVAVQWAETGAPIESLPATSLGVAALARAISLAAVAVALAALAAVPRLGGARGWLAVGATGALVLLVDVATGHAAAEATWLPQIAAQWVHGLGAAAWVGGLAGLLVVLRTTPAEDRLATARRYSSWAGIALAVVAITGAARAFAEIGTLERLFGTDFGRVVVAKTALLLAIALLGALNRFVTLPRWPRSARLLPRIGGAELALAAVVLGLSATLVNLSPPATAVTPTPPVDQPIVASGHDFGTSARARLVVTPGAAGTNTFDLALADFDSGAPIDASAIQLRFAIASASGVGESTLELERTAAGRFHGAGPNLSIDGIWRITATVTVTGGAVEVPIILATRVADQPVQQLVSPGLPTIYQVDLGAIGMGHVYLDQGGPGTNELHVTFFDAAGNEQRILVSTIAVVPNGADGELLTPRMLEPGHFVAEVEAIAGPLTVDVLAPLPAVLGSGLVHVHVTIEVTP